MDVTLQLAALVALLLLGYLVYAMLFPERF